MTSEYQNKGGLGGKASESSLIPVRLRRTRDQSLKITVQAVVQDAPLTVNEVGLGLLPFQLALKPGLAEAPGASVPLKLALVTVTLAPDCAKTPFHPCVICWLPGKVKFKVQLLQVVELVLVIVMEPPKPPVHWLVTV